VLPESAMRYFRSLSATLLSAATSFSLVTASCGTSAVGVDECRDIEQARCRADQPCGVITDVKACERYYRDHCLHGLATKPPGGGAVGACVAVIEAAGRCAAQDATTPLDECPETVTDVKRGLKTACDVVAHPELATECAFLLDTPPPEEGEGGTGSSDEPAAGGAGG
jgi:hypothetical protein